MRKIIRFAVRKRKRAHAFTPQLLGLTILLFFLSLLTLPINVEASSHREAPLIANDPLADNTDVYAFRSPDDPSTVTLIANYIPTELPQGGPNYYSFGENIRYEIHVDNDVSVVGDEVAYRATFTKVNEDPTTFFNIRLGAENLKTTYNLERSTDNGNTWQTIVTNGTVPPPNIGPRSIQSGVGLGAPSYESLIQGAIETATTGERVFCGPVDDPFFVDLGGIFDLGNAPRQIGNPRDGLARYNCHTIAIQVPIATLQKDGLPVSAAANILDSDFVIGVWASASRPAIRTLSNDFSGAAPDDSGTWMQVSRLGMPLTNEAVIPIGSKDEWNALTPYNENSAHYEFFYNPELALYMDDDAFGAAVPSFCPLRVQKKSLAGLVGPDFPGFDFSNGADGASILIGSPLLDGTVLIPNVDGGFGDFLLIPGKPRSLDLWPIFHTGAPNAPPYQLATGKNNIPVAPGKPFINNFLPNAGDMLRLNMAVPPTPRDDANFSSLGLIQAAVIGLVVAPFNTTTNLEFLPNMDGFPNGRRLEDDVTRIELQAVAGAVLAAVGLWYDDFDVTNPNASPVTQDLLNVLGYTTGVEQNDAPFRSTFPYMAAPWSGKDGNVPVPVPSKQKEACLYVSNTANPGVSVFQPTLANIIGPDRFVNSEVVDGNGIFVDEVGNRLIQLSRATSTITIYENATGISGATAPLTQFTDPAIVSGREIAYDPDKRILYVADNTADVIFVYDQPHTLSGMVSANRIIDLNGLTPWGITFDRANERLYVAEDLSVNFLVFDNPHTLNGVVPPTHRIAINGAVRTHGITYAPETDDLIVTDVAAANAGVDPAFAEDGAIFIIEDITEVLGSSPISITPDRTISGTATLLGNPVDVDVDARSGKGLIYIAEKTKGGSILAFDLNDNGNVAPKVGVRYPAVPEDIYLRKGAGNAAAGLYVSNTGMPGIGIYDPALSSWAFPDRQINTNQADGNGVVIDYENNRLYQLSRATSTVKVYDAADAVKGNATPMATFTDIAITSGREIALDIANQVLYVADNSANAIFAYHNPHTLTGDVSADRTLNLNGTPWGISYDGVGDRLFVAKDVTNMFQVYDNPLGLDGNVNPSNEVSINGATRTHGITYSEETDVLVVTEIGAASGGAFNEDGGIYVMNNISASLQTNPTNITPDFTIAGLNTQLGNPVDVAIDDRVFGSYIYVAEKTNGGKLLVFSATDNGDVRPILSSRYAVPEDIFLDKFKVKNPIIQITSSVYTELPVVDDKPLPSGLYVSNTANPGVSVYDPALTNVNPDRFIKTAAVDGNGIVIDEDNDRLIQLSRATATVSIYFAASLEDEEPVLLTKFTDPAIISGREIAYDAVRQILYVADNSANSIFVYDQPHLLSGSVSANRVIDMGAAVPWGISFDPVGDRLFVARDQTDAFQVYNNPHAINGAATPDSEISITGATRTHGITYSATSDILIVTEIGAASGGAFATDGGIYVIENASDVIDSGVASTPPTRTITGASTLLGNPVDVDLDDRSGVALIYIAEKTKGGYVLVYGLNDVGDVAPKVAKAYSGIPEDIYLQKGGSAEHASLYVSNTAMPGVGVFEPAFSGWAVPDRQISTGQADGNGIVVDQVNNRFYQLSRASKTIKVYNNANAVNGTAPSSYFTDVNIVSGREMALDIANQILFVASNSDSTILVYDNPSTLNGDVTADRILKLNGEPWGISFDPVGNRLFVAKDKTPIFQVYDNPGTLNGVVGPGAEVPIAGATRTHGITYATDSDVLVVTEIGAASGGAFNQDGGLYVIRAASTKIGGAPVTPDFTVAGLSTLLGNPVDVDYDDRAFGQYIYVAEKTNGGKLLIFEGDANGDARPTLAVRYAVPEDIFLDKSSTVNP